MDGPEEELLETVHDRYARAILTEVSEEPLTGPELVDRIDASKPTVYRRLSTLEELDLVATRVKPSEEGHHRTEYVISVRSMHLKFTSDGVSVTVERAAEDAVDRFRKLVGDLS